MNTQCPICGQGLNAKPIADYKKYKLHHCANCDTMFWNPMESIASETYDKYNVASALTYLNLRTIPWEQKTFLEELPHKGGKLLEIGCSTGEFLKSAREAGYSVSGIDSARETVEFAHSHFGLEEVYPFTVQEFITRKYDEKYDVVVFFQVLEHLADVPDFMDSVKKILKPGGFIALSVPNRDRWRFSSERFFREKSDLPPCHLTRWNIPSLVNLFSIYGFSVVSAEVEPLRLYERNWSNFISQKLGINPLAEILARKVISKNEDSHPTLPEQFSLRKTVTKVVGRLYLKAFFPLLAMLTMPLRVVLRRQGPSIYLLFSLKNQREG